MRLVRAALLLAFAATAAAAPPSTSPRFKTDQLGWLTWQAKVAVIDRPMQGFDAPSAFAPGPSVEVRRWSDDAAVLTVPLQPWNGGATHAQSGNRAWRADFSAVTTPGSYYLWDPATSAGSGRFEITDEAYRDLLTQALRSFYYQRCGVPKDAAHAGASWADAACHLGPQQDLDCRLVSNPGGPGLDLSGGWHDAGDYNKYVNFTDDPVHELLAAYEDYGLAFDDATGIPESGNGIPDILDEVRFQLEWFLKMQQADGSVLHKIAVTDFSAASPPSADAGPRRHAPATASATISACGAFAHGALVFEAQGDPGSQAFGARLRAAALLAWGWLEANPGAIPSSYDNAGFVNSSSEDSAYDQDANRTCAAAYLMALTGDTRYRTYFDAHYGDVHLMQWGYAYPFEATYQDGLLYYARSPLATPAVAAGIRAAFTGSMSGGDNLAHVTADEDAYRAYLADADYTWGSNWTKAKQGGMYLAMLRDGLDPANVVAYMEAAAGYLHYLNGVNPMGIAYFSNMGAHGAERSVNSFYHSWFADGTAWDDVTTSVIGPPPGFMPGGPNPSFTTDPAYTGPPIEPPENQPIQKSFLDWNGGWPEDSWEVTENQCAYQGAVVKLIAAHVPMLIPEPLSIANPDDTAGCMGGSATFLTSVRGGTPPYSLQWFHDASVIPGATSERLDLGPLALTDAGGYSVTVVDAAGTSLPTLIAMLAVDTPAASPADSLRVARSAADVVLSWGACARASAYDARRCDASGARPCTPSSFASVGAPAALDPAPPERMVWYSVAAVNACGATD